MDYLPDKKGWMNQHGSQTAVYRARQYREQQFSQIFNLSNKGVAHAVRNFCPVDTPHVPLKKGFIVLQKKHDDPAEE